MRCSSFVLLFAATVGVGCAARDDIDLTLAVSDDVRSIIIGVERGEALQVQAIDVDGTNRTGLPILPRYIGRDEVRLTAIQYTVPLEALQLLPGLVAFEAEGVPLPGGYKRIVETVVRGEDVASWEERPALDAVMAAFKRRGGDKDDCLGSGGCFDDTLANGSVCQSPCPDAMPPLGPTAATKPDFEVCPVGWTKLDLGDGIDVCTPFAAGVPTCPAFFGPLTSETGCHQFGAPCPAGAWPEGLTGDVVYVAENGTGDGSLNSPVGTIADAIVRANRGSTIALAKGRYAGDITIPDGVALVGACAEQTHIENATASDATVTVLGASHAEIRNVHITGRREGVSVEGRGSTLVMSGVVVTDTGLAGIDVSGGAHVEGDDILIGPNTVRGVRLIGGSTADLSHLTVDRAVRLGVYTQDTNSVLTMRDVAIIDTQPDASDADQFGRAIDIERNGRVVTERLFVTGAHNLAVFVSDNAQLEVHDAVVRETNSRADNGGFGDGFHVLRGGKIDLQRVWIDENRRHQIYLQADVATATLTDVVISNAKAEENGGEGSALRIYGGSQVYMRRSVIDSTLVSAVVARDADTFVYFEDVRVIDAGMAPGATSAATGVRMEAGAQLRAVRLEVSRTSGKAIHVSDEGSHADLEDISIFDAGSGTCLVCAGICGHSSGQIVGARILVQRGVGRAVNASDSGTDVELEDLTVQDTLPAPDCTTGVRSPLKGDGAGSIDGGHLGIRRFLIEDNLGAGIVVEDYIQTTNEDAGVDAADGTVQRNTVGANVLTLGYELLRVGNRVQYRDNGSNLNFGSL